MRYTRLLIGIAIILLALWVITFEQLSGASGDAVVNAPVSTLRAPVAGTVAMTPRALGASVRAGEELATITDPLVDSIRQDDLILEQALARIELARLDQQLAALDARIAALDGRSQAYHAARLAEIEARLAHARARLALLDGGTPSTGAEATSVAIEDARAAVAVLEIALQAAQAGVYLAEGYNDAPYSEQRRNDLETRRDAAAADRQAAADRLAALDDRLARERVHTARLGGSAVSATVDGQIWEALVSDGETVQRGQDLLRLLDCDLAFVTLSVPESTYNDLAVGDAAVFRLNGDSRSFEASVIRLGGAGAATLYRTLAVAPSQAHLERYDVALLVPALREVPELACAVGKTGRVFFDRRPLDWLRDRF